MNMFIHCLSLDIREPMTQAYINVKKGDTARKLIFTFSNYGSAYHISDGCTAVFRAKKPDGTILYNNCSINGNVIEYELTNQTISAEGIVECEVTLYGNDGRQITSPRFNIVVNDTIYADVEVESQNEFTQLTQAILGANNLNIEVERSGDGTAITITKKDGTSEQVIVSKVFSLNVFVITETEVVTNKTYAEIKAAIDAGDIICITDKNGVVYVPQVAKTGDKIELLWLDSHEDRTYRWSAVVNSENAWSVTLPELATTDELGNLAALKTQAADNLVAAINEVKQTADTKANAADLAPVATSGSYSDLTDKPTIPIVPTATIEANTAARHTHNNKTLLDSITEALKTAWNTASEWVSTNGANVLSHLSDSIKHITAAERTAWNGKQDKLIAGDNITIAADGKTISATGGGLSQNAKSLLITILRNATYEIDQTANITALETALSESTEPEQPESGIVQSGSVLAITSGVTAIQTGSMLAVA